MHVTLCCILVNCVLQEFRKHLIGLTDVTHTSFDKLVAQLERGFDDMDK